MLIFLGALGLGPHLDGRILNRAEVIMNTLEMPSNASILDCLRRDFGLEVRSLEALASGADPDAKVFRAEDPTERSFFVKVKKGQDPGLGAIMPLVLGSSGVKQVIQPLKTFQGAFQALLEGAVISVFPFMAGSDAFRAQLTNEQWKALGQTLRRIHEFQMPEELKQAIEHEKFSAASQKLLQRQLGRFEEVRPIDDCARDVQRVVREQIETIQSVLSRAQSLRGEIDKNPSRFVLCHSDIHGGNVLVQEGGSLYIVDWDHPILAPKERDLMFIGGGVANVWNDPLEEELFYQGYGDAQIDWTMLAYYRYARILEDLAFYIDALLIEPKPQASQAVMLKHFKDLFSPNGVVDRAHEAWLFYRDAK